MSVGEKVTAARRAAFDTLWRVETEAAYAGNLLASNRYDRLSREDHALLQELVLGVLRRQGQLDYLIEHYTRRKLPKLDLAVVIALRLGLYQLRFLSRVPPHAAINESVNLVKEQKKQSAAPLVNAALRSAQRDTDSDLAQSIKNPLEKLSFETSHPSWLLQRWIDRFGEEEARALAMANNNAPRLGFRFNTIRSSQDKTRAWFDEHGIRTRKSELTPQAEIIESGSLSPQSEPVREGWIYLQDEASQLVAHLTVVSRSPALPLSRSCSPPARLLDLCAAPGSKTTLLASLLTENSLVVAGDRYFHRLQTMKDLSARLGIDLIQLIQLDAEQDLPFAQPGDFDFVLLDAPCSGTGTLQRHPEIKWRMNVEKIQELAELQKRLIVNAASQVKVGGLLTYAVCSTEPEEGEEVIAWFRRNNPEFRDLTRERFVELEIDPALLLTSSFGARTFPHRQGTEGFFVCVMWKRRR
jgi:16S rRNA (cytosine967-C5)-methyltransferase